MKKSFILFIILLPLVAYAQSGFKCSTFADSSQLKSITKVTTLYDKGGRYITSEGTITSFILFVRFSDDNEITSLWPNASQLPTWAQNHLNQNYDPNGNYSSNSFSDYIFKNSYGKLHIIGDVFYVTLPQTESYYYTYSSSASTVRAKIEQDAFDQLPIEYPGIDLSKYDNWKNLKSGEEYLPDATPDKIVDMCWFIMRNLHDDHYAVNLYRAEAMLYADKTIGGVTIEKGFPGLGSRGSGISMFQSSWIDQMPDQTLINGKISELDNDGSHHTLMAVMIHELSHYFFGFNHFGDRNQTQFSSKRSSSEMIYACNNPTGATGNMLGYEKVRLNWITGSEIKIVTGNETFDLLDLSSFGTGIKIVQIPLDTDQSIFLENRQWTSPYEIKFAPENHGKLLAPGILAYLIPNEAYNISSTPVQQICSDGKWNWTRLSGTGPQNSTDRIEKSAQNSYSGYNELEDIYIDAHPLGEWLAGYWWQDFGTYWGPWYKGDNFSNENQNSYEFVGDKNDLFQEKDVISKWSNGATHKRISWSSNTLVATDIGIEIKSQNIDYSYTIEVRTSNPQMLAPSKPQLIQADFYSHNSVSIGWDANSEPDISPDGGYNIYREIYYGTTFLSEVKLNSTLLNSTSINDVIDFPTGIPANVNLYVRYKVEAVDNDGKVSNKGISNPLFLGETVSGYIVDPYTFDGKYIAVNDLDIINGINVTIDEGTQFTFLYGSSFKVNGSLNVLGKSGNEVTIDFIEIDYPNGIRYLNGSTGSIEYAIIKNGWYGVWAEYSNPDIEHSEISDCKYGIVYYNNNYTLGDAIVLNNHIHNNLLYGISFFNSIGKVRGNDINNNHRGVYCTTNSSPYLGEAGYYGNNNIYDNLYGVYAYNNSNPFLGRQACIEQGTRNILDNSTRNIYANDTCIVMAELNWWGQNPPDTNKFYAGNGSSINYTPYLLSAPFSKSSNRNPTQEELVFDQRFTTSNTEAGSFTTTNATSKLNPDWPFFWKLLYARNLIQIKEYKIAQDICMELISENPDSSLSFYALDLLWQASRKYDSKKFVTFLKTKTSSNSNKRIYAMMEMIGAGYEPLHIKVQNYDYIISKYSDQAIVKDILFQKFLYYLFEVDNIEYARAIAHEISIKFPGSEVAEEAQNNLGHKPIYKKSSNDSKNETESGMPKNFELKGNYPNPFNPSTNISYALPFESSVTLEIYDITGSLIRRYELPNNQAGYHNIAWNGKNSNNQNVASGIYIYKFRAKSLETNEIFVKSNKMMLIR